MPTAAATRTQNWPKTSAHAETSAPIKPNPWPRTKPARRPSLPMISEAGMVADIIDTY